MYPGIENIIRTAGIGVTLYFDSHHDISLVEAKDSTHNGSGGVAKVINGGIGDQYIYITFRSTAVGLGINMELIIYGLAHDNFNDFRMGSFVAGSDVIHT